MVRQRFLFSAVSKMFWYDVILVSIKIVDNNDRFITLTCHSHLLLGLCIA